MPHRRELISEAPSAGVGHRELAFADNLAWVCTSDFTQARAVSRRSRRYAVEGITELKTVVLHGAS